MAEPKYGGRDCELSTTGFNAGKQALDAWYVTRQVLTHLRPALTDLGAHVWNRQVVRDGDGRDYASPYSMDCLRHWTSGGQSFYADMCHVEVCTASCLYPTTFSAQCISTLMAAEAARQRAQLECNGETYVLTTANADLLDPAISFGTHLSMSVSSELWEDLCVDLRRPAILGFVSSALAAAIAFFGAGYLLPLRDGSTIYSLSARAHHLSKVKTLSTTQAFGRGLLNTRHEPHGQGHERLHLIGFDYCVLSSALLFSFLQCTLAAAEEGYCGLNLFDPVRALRAWSWSMDPATGRLPATAALIDGRQLTLPAYMQELTENLLQMCEAGLITAEIAPQAMDMLPRINELAHYAAEGSVTRCARHLTWAAKLLWLTQLCTNGGARLGDAQTRVADHDFSGTDPDNSPLWQLWEAGMVDPLVDKGDAQACLKEGPVESRDWGRGQIIQRFLGSVVDVDWSFVDLCSAADRWSPRTRVELPHLDSLNKQKFAVAIHSATDPEHLKQLLVPENGSHAQMTDPLDDVTRQLAVVKDS